MSIANTLDNNSYSFATDWFSHNLLGLSQIFEELKPSKILEVGSFEGRSTVHFIEMSGKYHKSFEIYCIDSWLGGTEHIGLWDMSAVEKRFKHNVEVALKKCNEQVELKVIKALSHKGMMSLLTKGYDNYFDFIYIDASHEAPDVLLDALLAHKLVRIGGIIAFDDYLWSPNPQTQENHYTLVKPAVDHYVNTYQRKVSVIQNLPLYQLYVMKLSD